MLDKSAEAAAVTAAGQVIGQSVSRLEDLALVTGSGRFIADMSLPFQLHMRIVRSPLAHGRLLGIDGSRALAMSGVVAVWTSEDIADVPPVDFRDPSAEALLPYRQPVLARERVRYVGEPVAAVFAQRHLRRRGRSRSCDARDRAFAGSDVGIDAACRFRERAFDRSDRAAPQLRRHRAGLCGRARGDRARSGASGRHSAVPMETRGAIGSL